MGLSCLFICYHFSPGLRMDIQEKQKGLQMISAHLHTSSGGRHGYRGNHGPRPPRRRRTRDVGSVLLPTSFSHAGTWIQTQQSLSSDVVGSSSFFNIYFGFFQSSLFCRYADHTLCKAIKLSQDDVFCRRWRANRSDAVLKLV